MFKRKTVLVLIMVSNDLSTVPCEVTHLFAKATRKVCVVPKGMAFDPFWPVIGYTI